MVKCCNNGELKCKTYNNKENTYLFKTKLCLKLNKIMFLEKPFGGVENTGCPQTVRTIEI